MKRITLAIIYSIIATSLLMISCSDDIDERTTLPPEIVIEQENSTFITKVGKEITITPIYKNAEKASYAWKLDNKIISTAPSLTYKSDEVEDVYLVLEVVNEAGIAYKELKISVAPLIIPSISLAVPPNGYMIVQDTELKLVPDMEEYNEEISFSWFVNNKEVLSEKDYTFSSKEVGVYTLKVIAYSEDGQSDPIEFTVEVCSPEDLPFNWSFETDNFSLSSGRRIRIKIWDIENEFDANYIWEVNNKVEQEGKETQFIFDKTAMGDYNVKVTMKNQYAELSRQLKVTVSGEEGTYKRPATTASKTASSKVYEYMPAPGQFINEFLNAQSIQGANNYAENRFKEGFHVSLGAWGGYIVVGFDHSIENDGSYNIQILGNSFAGSSEPGIVWVMQDENGNGLPDDTWYELKGSEYGKPETIQDYAITYYKPKSSKMPVQWIDNQGKTGTVDYLAAYHSQDYYYPNWVKENTYTLRGTRLESRTYDKSGSGVLWQNDSFEWGYADNYSLIDRLTDDENAGADINANHFKISNAVTFDGKPANLKYVDFVKVQTAVNAKAGWLGEVSTEVFGVNDYNLIKK